MYGYGFLSTLVRAGLIRFSPILGDSSRDGRILGVNRAPYGGICFLLKHLLFFGKDRRTDRYTVEHCSTAAVRRRDGLTLSHYWNSCFRSTSVYITSWPIDLQDTQHFHAYLPQPPHQRSENYEQSPFFLHAVTAQTMELYIGAYRFF